VSLQGSSQRSQVKAGQKADGGDVSLRANLRADADRYLQGWSKITSKPGPVLMLRLLLLTPGFQFVLWLRLQRSFGRMPVVGGFLQRLAWYFTNIVFPSDVDTTARFGPGLHVPHPTGIVIGAGSRVGANVTILQHVTLGQAHRGSREAPTIQDGVEIGVGACVLGPVTIGASAVIGANSVVLRDVAPGAVAVGVPARELQRSGM